MYRQGFCSRSFRLWLIGHQMYGNLEWAFKWMKILLIIGLDILMIAINRGGKSGPRLGGMQYEY